jgi:hypothetical protein
MRIRTTVSLLGSLLLAGACSTYTKSSAAPVATVATNARCVPIPKGCVAAAPTPPAERQLVYGRDEAVKAARLYAKEARALDDRARNPIHPKETHALRTLADAIAFFPEGSPSADAVRSRADAIQNSDPKSLQHADDLKGGLTESLDVLDRFGRDRSIAGVDERVSDARQSLEGIENGKPLLKQLPAAHKAMRKVGDALVFSAESMPVERQPVRGFGEKKPDVDQP